MKKLILLSVLALMMSCADDAEDTVPVFENEVEVISAELKASLSFMREEEKLARDVYLKLFEKWQSDIFQNIAQSEQKHMDAVKSLIEQFGLEDPINQDVVGVFQNEELSQLYLDLMAQGSRSLIEAYRVGALIEEVDIQDLDVALSTFVQPEVIQVYQNLNKGSRNHLRSFYGSLVNLGEDYQAQVLSSDYFYTIVDSPMETGK